MLSEYAKECGYTLEEMKHRWKMQIAPNVCCYVSEDGMLIPRSSAALTIDQLTVAIEMLLNHFTMTFGRKLPDIQDKLAIEEMQERQRSQRAYLMAETH